MRKIIFLFVLNFFSISNSATCKIYWFGRELHNYQVPNCSECHKSFLSIEKDIKDVVERRGEVYDSSVSYNCSEFSFGPSTPLSAASADTPPSAQEAQLHLVGGADTPLYVED